MSPTIRRGVTATLLSMLRYPDSNSHTQNIETEEVKPMFAATLTTAAEQLQQVVLAVLYSGCRLKSRC